MNNEKLNTEVLNTQPIEVMDETSFTLRKLQASELFPILTILRKIGFKNFTALLQEESVKNIIRKTQNGEEIAEDEMSELGSIIFSIVDIIISGMEQCETEIYKVLSNVSGLTVSEISRLEIDVFTGMIIEVVKSNVDFIKAVSKYLK